MTHLNQLKTSLFFIFGLFSSFQLISQDDVVIYDNEVYVDYIKSVSFYISGLQTSLPILNLGSGTLNLSFDDMGGSFYDYSYAIVHCDKDWNRSEIDEIEYLDGFAGELVEDFTTSENTYVDYTHYSLTIPNQDVSIILSGNYLLIINDEQGLPIITKRFIVYDPRVIISSERRKTNKVENINSHQAIYFHIIDESKYVSNPYDEVFVSMLQNGRWDSSLNNLRPDNTIGNNIYFNLNRPFSFPGYKEFRNFDIRNLEAATRNVHSVDLSLEGTKAILELSKNRYFGNYTQENDANGTFVFDNQNDRRWDSEDAVSMDNNHRGAISGDYVDVYFALSTIEIEDKDVYCVGGFSDWKLRPEFKMTYNDTRKLYLGNSLFKQGYFDYYYAVADDEGLPNTEILEGSNYATENDYLIIVYKRAFGNNYDEIIAINQINSTDNQ